MPPRHSRWGVVNAVDRTVNGFRVSLESEPRRVGTTQKIVCVHMVCTLSWCVHYHGVVFFEPILYPPPGCVRLHAHALTTIRHVLDV
jgi:hypothetical protein